MDGIVILGPTGVGKTSLSINLAKELNLDIISADSMQVYKNMDIGTAKIKENEKSGIKHYMLDIVNPDESFNVGMYEEKVNLILKKLEKEKKNVLIVGGTGLYIDAVTRGFANLPESDMELRKNLESQNKDENYKKLMWIDPEAAKEIHPNNAKRVVRALEVCILTGKKFSELKSINIKNNNYKFYKYGIERSREKLYDKINQRVEIMFENGILEESKFLYENYKDAITSSQAIGYKEIFEYFDGKISLEKAKDLIKQNSRNYAKRQFTWFKNDKEIKWFNLDEINEEDIIKKILEEVKI